MPISTTDLYNAYLAYFGRPPDLAGLAYFSGKTEAEVLAAFSASEESQQLLGGSSVEAQINNIYLNLFNRNAEFDGLKYWLGQINDPVNPITLADAAMQILRGAQGDDLATVQAKNNAMVEFVNAIDTTQEAIGYNGAESAADARAFISTVGYHWNAAGDVNDGILAIPTEDQIDAAVLAATTSSVEPETDQTLFLVESRDNLQGDIGNDLFIADVVQNQLGIQVNTLGTGDRLDGNAGNDMLEAQVSEGANYGGLGMPIQPRTTSIETVKFEALNSRIGHDQVGETIGLDLDGIVGALGDLLGGLQNNQGGLTLPASFPLLDVTPVMAVHSTEVYVNAKDMTDVNAMWSWYSDANLTIQGMTTLDENGGMRNLADMTIGMGYSGNKDSHWNESDYHVYFDQDYLVPGQSYNNEAFYFLLDQDAEQEGNPPLNNINVDGFLFRIGDGPILNLQSDAAALSETWAGFVAALQAPLQAMIDAGMVPADTTLTLDPSITDTTFLDDGSESSPIPAMVISTRTNVAVTPVGFSQVEDAIGEFNVYGRFSNTSDSETELLSINVALEKVGLAADGGQLVIGSMAKDECNVWSDDTADQGIQQFNVTVYGNEAKSSSLAGLHSTNNTLEKVVVKSGVVAGMGEKDYADLTIGNSNTKTLNSAEKSIPIGDRELVFTHDDDGCFDCDDVFSGALKDVQTFDSSAFLGDLTLFASLTSEITAKYLDQQDIQTDPTADNIDFDYITGVGDDFVALTVSSNNYADAGAATREDFELVVNTGAGNDQVVLSIVDCDGEDDCVGGFEGRGGEQIGFDNWYDNQKLNANITINTETGNDIVRTGASGDFIINTGADNDTVYLQNTGEKAVWVYNTRTDGSIHTELNNLQSDANNKYQIYDGSLTVTFRHLTATVDLPDTNGIVSDLQVNQAIKNAINKDPVLSKLLVATDGPANTLVVKSLIDGDEDDDFGNLGDDLTISLQAPSVLDLSVGEVAQLAGWYAMPGATAASLVAHMNGQIAAFDLKADYYETFATINGNAIYGEDSCGSSDNHITGGTGNDVIVLGTGHLSNDTVIYSAPFGNDVIVNFTGSEINVETETVLNTAEVAMITQGAAATAAVNNPGSPETFTLEVTAGNAIGGTVLFDGGTATIGANATLAQVVAAFVAAAPAYTNYTAAAGAAPGTVVFTQTGPGFSDIPDATVASFSPSPTVSGVVVAVLNNTDGVAPSVTPATPVATEVFSVTFGVGDTDTSYTFDGEEIPVLAGETAENIAAAAASGNYTNWTAVLSAPTVVTFTAKVAGPVPDVVDADFVGANILEIGYGESFASSDWLDFTGLGGKGAAFAGTAVSNTNGSITVVAETIANDTGAEIAAMYTDGALATKHIYIAYNSANVGDVWQVVDAAGVGAGSVTATLMGTIDLADTDWGSLQAVNFV